MECDKMALAAPDYPGGRNNVTPSGETETLPCDLAILALGYRHAEFDSLETDPSGRIKVDEAMECSKKMVFAGGDCVSGAATFIKAVAAGNNAAAAIVNALPIYFI